MHHRPHGQHSFLSRVRRKLQRCSTSRPHWQPAKLGALDQIGIQRQRHTDWTLAGLAARRSAAACSLAAAGSGFAEGQESSDPRRRSGLEREWVRGPP